MFSAAATRCSHPGAARRLTTQTNPTTPALRAVSAWSSLCPSSTRLLSLGHVQFQRNRARSSRCLFASPAPSLLALEPPPKGWHLLLQQHLSAEPPPKGWHLLLQQHLSAPNGRPRRPVAVRHGEPLPGLCRFSRRWQQGRRRARQHQGERGGYRRQIAASHRLEQLAARPRTADWSLCHLRGGRAPNETGPPGDRFPVTNYGPRARPADPSLSMPQSGNPMRLNTPRS